LIKFLFINNSQCRCEVGTCSFRYHPERSYRDEAIPCHQETAHRTPERASGRCGVRRTLALAGSAWECRLKTHLPWRAVPGRAPRTVSPLGSDMIHLRKKRIEVCVFVVIILVFGALQKRDYKIGYGGHRRFDGNLENIIGDDESQK
jgi:hypothetical protein